MSSLQYLVISPPWQSVQQLGLLSNSGVIQVTLLIEGMTMDLQQEANETGSFTNLLDFFDMRFSQFPAKVAVICGNMQLTYQDLDQRANRLAGYLVRLGVQPGMLVGICVSRSVEMVVAILGVIKAGGAYVPLDPSYPAERLAFILQDAQSYFVVTQSEYLGLFAGLDIRTISLDQDGREIEGQPVIRPEVTVSPDHLAYVIYTSGSTGKPKGVMITHSNLINFIEIASTALDVTSDDIYLQSASIAYALSVRQLMIPLALGATAVVAASGEIADPLALFKLIKARRITLMDVVPSFWRSCVQRLLDLNAEERGDLLDNSLRRIVSIGEALMSDLPRDWRFQLGHKATLVNIFGQTETTGVVATYPIPPDPQGPIGVVPIGRSVPRTKIYILDPDLRPLPNGEVGELCVSNPCLALGYLRRPDLTAGKFIPNPFSDGFSERLYRTGDMARYRPDGTIEFLGRGDFQVKIRGQRLELGEVESVLREHEAVGDCAVIARESSPDEKYLAAYVVPNQKRTISTTGLRNFMRSRLPDYMVPSIFILLDALPLTPNGKVNRLAFPAPESLGLEEQELSDEMVLPRTPAEKTIAGIWKKLMKLDRVGIHDNFFDLGGHSLLAVRILARIESDLGVRLPLTSFFHSATIAQLAELVERKADEVRDWSPVVPIQTRGDKPPFFGIHAHEGGVLFWRNIVEHLPPDQPFYAIQAQGVDGIRPALNRIEDMAALYLDAIQKLQPHGPYYLGGFSMGGEIAFEMAQQLIRQGEKVELLVMLDTRNPQRSTRPVIHRPSGETLPDLKAQINPNRTYQFGMKVRSHFLELKERDWTGKIKYLSQAFTFRLQRSSVYFKANLYRKLNKRLPDPLLLQYLRYKHSEALRYYVPSRYLGKVTLFRASETLDENPDDDPMGWMPLAAGGVDIHHFDASHNIVNNEYAKEIASKLTECLSAAYKF